ncbi:MAG: ion channel [Vulcanimicrobiota bacterium]
MSENNPAARGFWDSYAGMLVSIIMLIIFSPFIDRTFSGFIIMDLLFGCVIFVGFASLFMEKRKIFLGVAVLLIALIIDLSNHKGTTSLQIVVSSSLELVFLGYITIKMLSNILSAKRVTSNEIYGALCVYFLMGIIWALIYYLIEFTWPGSYSSLPKICVPGEITFETSMNIFSTLLYFSYITITSVGYGDCTPLTIMSRGFSNIEAVFGQLYLILIVSRLVGLYLQDRRQKVLGASENSPAGEVAPTTPADGEKKLKARHGHLSLKDIFKNASSCLFISLLTYMAFTPILVKEAKTPYIFIKLIFFAIIISGVRLVKDNRKVLIGLLVLIFIIIIIDIHLLAGEAIALILPVSCVRLVVLIIITLAAFTNLSHKEEVTHDHIITAASIYILLGCLWGEIFYIIELFSHGSFMFNGAPWHNYGTFILLERLKADLLSFSLTTLTTVGYGDTVPFSHVARLWTYLEAITGVIYLVVLIGYLVAARVSQMECEDS